MRFMLLAIIALNLSCLKFSKEKDSFGLRKIEFEVSSENLGKLNSTVEAKTPYAADVYIDGKKLDAKINYAGRSTIDYFKKSYDVEFQGGAKFENKQSIRLSAQAQDPTFVRSLSGLAVYRNENLLASDAEPVVVYLNGKLQGLYLLIEPVDRGFFKRRDRGFQSLFKAKFANADFSSNNLSNIKEAFSIQGETDQISDLRYLIDLVNKDNSDENQKALSKILNIESYLKYLAVTVYLNHWDGMTNNFFLFRENNDAPFELVAWDLDRIYENSPVGTKDYTPKETPFEGNALIKKVLSYSDYRARYLDIIKQLMTKDVPPETFLTQVDAHVVNIQDAFKADRVLTANGHNLSDEANILKDAIKRWHEALKNDVLSAK